MRFSWMYLPLLVAAAAPGACSLAAEEPKPASSPPGVPGPNATLAFDEQGTLALAPGELRLVSVTGSPPASYEVSFTILGAAAGAFLDRTTVAADPGGHAAVRLHAPSLASTFRLRAAIKDGPSAERNVAVSDKGFGTIRVVPMYQGQREVIAWTASVVAGTTCAEIAAALPGEPAGALITTAAPEEEVLIESAPVGPNLAVTLRAGQAMWGCADEPDLQAGSTRDVKVAVKDTPIDLGSTDLDLTLTFDAPEGLAALLDGAADLLVEGFLPAGEEATALLDAMQLAAASEATAFAAERASLGWDQLAAAHLDALPAPLAATCRGWAALGLSQQPGEIAGRLTAVGDAPGHALLAVASLGAITAEDAGVPPAHLVSWMSEPGDVLQLSGELFWMPSRYAGAAAWQGAQASAPGAGSIRDALAAEAQCDALGAVLGGFAACDATCMADLCAAGLEARWALGVDASATAGLVGGISVSAAGPAKVDEAAVPLSWDAPWLGTITDGQGAAVSVMGQVSGVAASGGGPD